MQNIINHNAHQLCDKINKLKINGYTMSHKPTIALLSTGDEIVSGEITNTNARDLAALLNEANIIVGNHLSCSDDESDILNSLNYLLTSHEVVICTGGLGPTIDDRTRNVVSQVIQQPLIFNQSSWQRIEQHFHARNRVPNQANKQQCYFPENAEIFENVNGTADGFCSLYRGKKIYCLPGPPNECLPMFKTSLLPKLIKDYAEITLYRDRWSVFGVGESTISTLLDQALAPFDCEVSYRYRFPYIDCKVRTADKHQFTLIQQNAEKVLATYLLPCAAQTSLELLSNYLNKITQPIYIIDRATHGYLQASLDKPSLQDKLIFTTKKLEIENVQIEIDGLDGYWSNTQSKIQNILSLRLHTPTASTAFDTKFPLQDKRLLEYATHYIAYQLYLFLKTL